ncbi:hypothetical protein CR513_11158, partial [Mucuna pruriens]
MVLASLLLLEPYWNGVPEQSRPDGRPPLFNLFSLLPSEPFTFPCASSSDPSHPSQGSLQPSTLFQPQPSSTSNGELRTLVVDLCILFAGSHSNESSGSSNPSSSSTRGDKTQHYAIPVAEEEFLFKILFREAEESDSEGLPSWIDPRVSEVYFVYTNSDSLVGMADAICWHDPWSVEVLPCRSDEIVCEWVAKTKEPFFNLYETLFSKLGIKLPFTDFERVVMGAEYHPNPAST